jgi:NADH-quinone oxidoreductase subunit H
MRLGWKFLIPASLVWILAVAAVRALILEGFEVREVLLYGAGGVLAVLVLTSIWDAMASRSAEAAADEEAEEAPAEFDPYAGGYPVPPLPGQRSSALVGAQSSESSDREIPPQESENSGA